MRVDLALLADAATVDGTGKLNILGIFDRIASRGFPARHGRMALVLRFVGDATDAGEHSVQIRLRDPDGTQLVGLDGALELGIGSGAGEGRARIPHVLNLESLVFPRAGEYAFDVLLDGKPEVSIPLTVAEAGPLQPDGGTEGGDDGGPGGPGGTSTGGTPPGWLFGGGMVKA